MEPTELTYADPTPSPAQTIATLARLLQWQLDELKQTRRELDLARAESDSLERDLRSVQRKLVESRQEVEILQEELAEASQRADIFSPNLLISEENPASSDDDEILTDKRYSEIKVSIKNGDLGGKVCSVENEEYRVAAFGRTRDSVITNLICSLFSQLWAHINLARANSTSEAVPTVCIRCLDEAPELKKAATEGGIVVSVQCTTCLGKIEKALKKPLWEYFKG